MPLCRSHLPPQNEEGLKNKIASIIYRWYKQEGLKNKVAGLIYKYGFDPSKNACYDEICVTK